MFSGTPRPRPVIGLLAIGGVLILIEGAIELVTVSPVPGQFLFSPILAIILAVLILLFTAIVAGESSFLGWLFIILGALSFLVGGGFVVGGIFVVLAGALEIFSDWAEEMVGLELAAQGRTVVTPTAAGGDDTTSSTGATSRGKDNLRTHAAPGAPTLSRCRFCGTLNPAARKSCVECGRVFDSEGPHRAAFGSDER